MNDNLSTQFPKPPELQPLAGPSAKGRQIFSSLLIVIGVVLLATGGWMFVQYQIEDSKPPPARILEVSVADLTETPVPTPTTRPTSTPRPTVTIVFATPSPTAASQLGDTVLVKATNTRVPPASPTPEATATPEPSPTPTIVEPTVEPTTEALSLESNPLVVEEPAGAELVPASPGEAAVSPITRIVAETIGLDAPVIAVGWVTEDRGGVPTNIWTVADYAAGWHKNSALPGQGGNIVLSGHHNIKGEVFRYTIDMNVGDIITIYMGDQPYKYAVVDKFIVKDKGEPDAVRRENAKWIAPFNEERLTLVTCWPYTNNTHRAIVIAKPVQ